MLFEHDIFPRTDYLVFNWFPVWSYGKWADEAFAGPDNIFMTLDVNLKSFRICNVITNEGLTGQVVDKVNFSRDLYEGRLLAQVLRKVDIHNCIFVGEVNFVSEPPDLNGWNSLN